MNYRQSLVFLSSLIDYERWVHRNYEFKLDNFFAFLEKIGNPQKKLTRVVLVAGTKGKGSTATMLSEILQAHGEKVGLYTSPHLLDYPERIRLNARTIPRTRFASISDDLRPRIAAHEPRITFFEALTALAFNYFLKEETTVNVLEVGMGGRLDATNVTDPELSIITRIGYDHTQILGKTLSAIAWEKCGILRPSKPAVIAAQRSVVRKAIRETVDTTGTDAFWWEKDFKADLLEEGTAGLRMHYRGIRLEADFDLPLIGAHQVENAAAALAASELLLAEINEKRSGKALFGLKLPARIEVVNRKPTVILDMSHNPESAATLRRTLDAKFAAHRRRILLIGITKKKDNRGMLRLLAPFFTEIRLVQASFPRAESKEKLFKVCRSMHHDCRTEESVEQGITSILDSTAGEDLLVISGSIYVAGEALEALKTRERAKVKG